VGVRTACQRRGLGRALYQHFEEIARGRGCAALKAVTAPFNADSRAFHLRMGFAIEPGDLDPSGVEVYTDYHGRGESVSIFRKPL
jgi:GNAT superfamily N-acetyltransferase